MVERVGEVGRCRRRTVAKTGVIRGNNMEVVLQVGNQIPEHMRRGRETVQENERGKMGLSSFPIKKVEAVDPDVVVSRHDTELSVKFNRG